MHSYILNLLFGHLSLRQRNSQELNVMQYLQLHGTQCLLKRLPFLSFTAQSNGNK